jgi:hypothetical protein
MCKFETIYLFLLKYNISELSTSSYQFNLFGLNWLVCNLICY